MAFETSDKIVGKIYVPECIESCSKKHDCKDCFSCQFCSDERCEACLKKNDEK